MKRGELWTLRDGGYASKPRPVLILQADGLAFDSVVLCLVTSYDSRALPTRIAISPDDDNGLRKMSYIMTEKIVTVDKAMLGRRIGSLSAEHMHSVARGVAQVLGITGEELA